MLNETKSTILSLTEEPRTYTELKNETGVTDRAILQHLKDLKESGLIEQKEIHGPWSLTSEGLKILVKNRAMNELSDLKEIRPHKGFFEYLKDQRKHDKLLKELEKKYNDKEKAEAIFQIIDKIIEDSFKIYQTSSFDASNPSAVLYSVNFPKAYEKTWKEIEFYNQGKSEIKPLKIEDLKKNRLRYLPFTEHRQDYSKDDKQFVFDKAKEILQETLEGIKFPLLV